MPDPSRQPVTPVFDGHNDVLLRLWLKKGDVPPERRFLDGEEAGHIDLPRARAGGLAGGLFAVFPPPLDMGAIGKGMDRPSYDLPLPPDLALEHAQASTTGMAALLLRIARAAPDDVQLCGSVADIRAAMAAGRLATVLHIEGAEPIDPGLAMLDVLHAAGLRSLGIVWSRANAFGHGVPFRFPGTPDIGPGLTDAGKALVRACNELGILVDLSHLNEAGFRDVARLSSAPLVATHSNVHAICATPRNLTGEQLAMIRDSRGVVGLNFATSFLRPDGQMRADTPIEAMLAHLDAMLEALGEDGVALGSDFDGAVVPAGISTVAGLPALVAAMRRHGYGEELVEKIAWRNWLGVLERTWGA